MIRGDRQGGPSRGTVRGDRQGGPSASTFREDVSQVSHLLRFDESIRGLVTSSSERGLHSAACLSVWLEGSRIHLFNESFYDR